MRLRLRELVDDAIKTVSEIIGGTDIPPGVRLKAALSVLQCAAARDELEGEAAALDKWRTDSNPFNALLWGREA